MNLFDSVQQDARQALRVLLRQWGFTVAAVLTVAIGAGANATIFSLVNALLLRPLPVHEPERMVNLHATTAQVRFGNFSYPDFMALRERVTALDQLAAFNEVTAILQTDGFSDRIAGEVVSGNYFATLGLRPAAGRFFAPDEESVASPRPVIVLSYALWQRVFQGDADVINREVRLGGVPFTVIGVAPQNFRGLFRGVDYAFWAPLPAISLAERERASVADRFRDSEREWLELFGRLREGATAQRAQAELSQLRRQLLEQRGVTQRGAAVELFATTGLPDQRRGPIVLFLATLAALGALVLLIACVNLAGMLVARGMTRSGEIALRSALGASRTRVLSGLAIENGILLLAGALLGTLAATWTTDLFPRLLPPTDVQLALDLSVDHRVTGVTLGLTVALGLLLGVLPALQASRLDIASVLRGAGRSLKPQRMRARQLLVSAQIAVSMLLVIVAGLFVRALNRGQAVDPGFDYDNVVAAAVEPGPEAATPAAAAQFFEVLAQRVSSRPDVEAVAYAHRLPLGQGNRMMAVTVAGKEAAPGQPVFELFTNAVTPDYFSLLRIELLRGRAFSSADRENSRPVAIVSHGFAQRVWPDADPVGQVVRDQVSGTDLEIVGVAADIKFRSLAREAPFAIYRPVAQTRSQQTELMLHARTANPSAVLRAINTEVRTLLPSAATFQAATLERHIGFLLVAQRVASSVTTVLSVLGMVLAGLGLYAVVAFWLVQRRRELALRTALGARPADLVRMVLGEGLRVALVGGAIGVLLAAAGTRVLGSFLFGVSPLDPLVYTAALGALFVLVLVACAEPLRRALRLQPMRVLREDG